jgi:MFS family permease
MNQPPQSIETRRSWIVATVALAVLTVSYGAPLVTVVALKPIAAEFGTARSAPALAVSLTYIGAGIGGIAMGWMSGRIGARRVTIMCCTMISLGLVAASSGGIWHLYASNLLLIGLLGASGMFSPLMAYVSRWFDRHRGSGVALISSGQYVAGAVWPVVFQVAIERYGWRTTMLLYAVVVVAVIIPLAAIFFGPPPDARTSVAGAGAQRQETINGLPPNVVLGLLALAIFCCCVTMAIPLTHIVAFCGDIGIGATQGAAMLSVQLTAGFAAQQLWGWVADRLGGIRTVLSASACLAVAMSGFLITRNEYALFSISAAFGLAFGGLIPGYILAIRELFPAEEASWRIPIVMFPGALGMAAGGWFGGLVYDSFGYYTPAFAIALAFNLANLMVVGTLAVRRGPRQLAPAMG